MSTAGAGGPAAPGMVTWQEGATLRSARWISPVSPPPGRCGAVGDATRAAEAFARARRGEGLVYGGDYQNARQLLSAVARRLPSPRPSGPGPAAAFRAERSRVLAEHAILSRLAIPIAPGWEIPLRRAPDARAALEAALGPAPAGDALLPLRDLLGVIGAHEWRRRGLPLAALGGDRVHPHYGVYAPIRAEPVDLVAAAAAAWPPAGKTAFDVGTGTGVLAVLLARAGARVIATDLEARAVQCARENAARLGVADRVEVRAADLFPDGTAELVVSNPPWVPADAHTPLDRAVYDPGGRFLERLVAGLPARLAPGGEAWIVISDLAELLGLRPAGHLEALAAAAGLAVRDVRAAAPTHPRARDRADPLHAIRAREVTRLFRLVRR